MALSKLFQRIFWHNNTTPAINEDNLNAMSKAIDDIDNRVIALGDDVMTVVPQIAAYLEQAEDLVEAMELLSENPPYIGSNGNWYVWDTNTSSFKDSGVDASITVDIADITMLAPDATPYVTNTGTATDPVFHLFIPRGATGNGISTIAKTGTSGLVDTYTITMTNGTTSTFTVTNGSGDMNKSVYDPTNAIANAGGMKSAAAKNSTNAVTANSTDLVESGAVYTADKDIYEVMGQNGAKNLLRQVNNGPKTTGGITFTPNNDGSITLSGTASSSAQYYYPANGTTSLSTGDEGVWLTKGNYIASGGVETRNGDVQVLDATESPSTYIVDSVVGDTPFTLTKDTLVVVRIRVASNKTASGTAYPMIRLASDLDPTYQPYAETNQQLTSKTDGLWDNMMDNGAVNISPNNFTGRTDQGITFVVNADKTVTASTESGGATANGNVNISFPLKKGTYRLTGCPSGGSSTKYRLYVNAGSNHFDYGDGVEFTLSSDTTVTLYCSVLSGTVLTTPITFKPMISDASLNLSYDDYVPYAKSNRELTEETADGQAQNFGVMGANTSPSFLNGEKPFNKTIMEIFAAMPVTFNNGTGGSNSVGSVIRITTYSSPTSILFSDIANLTGATVEAGYLEITKLEAARGSVTYHKSGAIFEAAIISNTLQTCYAMTMSAVTP